MCSWSVNALLRCSIERNTLIASSYLEAPQQRASRTKDVVQVLLVSTYDYIGTHAYGYLVLGCFYLIYLQCPCLMCIMNSLIHAMPVHLSLYLRCFPSCCLLQLLLLLFFISLLLLFHYCHFHKTVTTCGSSRLFSGAVAGEHSSIYKFT